MGPRGVVGLETFVGPLPYLRERREDPGTEDFVAVIPVEAFN